MIPIEMTKFLIPLIVYSGFILGQSDMSKDYGISDIEVNAGLSQSATTLAGITLIVFVSAILFGARGLRKFLQIYANYDKFTHSQYRDFRFFMTISARISVAMFISASSFICLLAIRTISLPGAMEGLQYYLAPNWAQLHNYEVIY